MTDTEILNYLQSLTVGYGTGWILRKSTTLRGMRLHETSGLGATSTVRQAIIDYKNDTKEDRQTTPSTTPINSDCPQCKGTGTIRFFFDEDTTHDCKCPKCFPGEKAVYEKLLRNFRSDVGQRS